MINITDKKECCGCNACGDICSNHAIKFKTDIEGFLYPIVNKSLCTNCGLCEKVCPVININNLKNNDFKVPMCYAMQTKNLESLFNSTSGSAFSTLAEKMYKEGGYVGGAIYDDLYNVKQFVSSCKDDLEKLRNSKLVQSDAQGFYKAVRDIVKSGHKCLVCGLPCQMAALKAFLKRDYENLIVVDLICRGINTPILLKGYMDLLEKRHNSKIVYFKVKNKEYGWRELTTKVIFENGDVLYDTKKKNIFTISYLRTNAFCRPSCYDCKFKGYPRIADITLGDLWGAEKIVGKELDSDLGTSIVMANSEKGKAYYEKCISKAKSVVIPFELATRGNPALNKSLLPPRVDRDQLYKDLQTQDFESVLEKYRLLPDKLNVTYKRILINIVRFIHSLFFACGFNVFLYIKNFYYNFLKKGIKTNVLNGSYLIIHSNSVIRVSKKAKIFINGPFTFGTKRVKGSKLESRLLVEKNSYLYVEGKANVPYGADIEVFNGGCLTIGDGFAANINCTIICTDNITIGERVSFGRDVSVRDNNGGHYLSRRTYKDKRPVIIGQHCWICEGATIMPGTKLGTGVIVGAKSVVTGGNYKNFSMLFGCPAEVVDEDIYVKM